MTYPSNGDIWYMDHRSTPVSTKASPADHVGPAMFARHSFDAVHPTHNDMPFAMPDAALLSSQLTASNTSSNVTSRHASDSPATHVSNSLDISSSDFAVALNVAGLNGNGMVNGLSLDDVQRLLSDQSGSPIRSDNAILANASSMPLQYPSQLQVEQQQRQQHGLRSQSSPHIHMGPLGEPNMASLQHQPVGDSQSSLGLPWGAMARIPAQQQANHAPIGQNATVGLLGLGDGVAGGSDNPMQMLPTMASGMSDPSSSSSPTFDPSASVSALGFFPQVSAAAAAAAAAAASANAELSLLQATSSAQSSGPLPLLTLASSLNGDLMLDRTDNGQQQHLRPATETNENLLIGSRHHRATTSPSMLSPYPLARQGDARLSLPQPGSLHANGEAAAAPVKVRRSTIGGSTAGTTRRTKFRRSRTGCLVCRIRKVRCDQDGLPCKQCRVGKRDCHYEDHPPKRKRKGKKDAAAAADLQEERQDSSLDRESVEENGTLMTTTSSTPSSRLTPQNSSMPLLDGGIDLSSQRALLDQFSEVTKMRLNRLQEIGNEQFQDKQGERLLGSPGEQKAGHFGQGVVANTDQVWSSSSDIIA